MVLFKDSVGDELRVDVAIRSVSPEGLGAGASADAELPDVGKLVTIKFQIGQMDVSLPGRVVWRQRGPSHSAIGIHLALALAQSSMRHAYASWIVARLGKSGRHPRSGDPSSGAAPEGAGAVPPRSAGVFVPARSS